MWIGISFLLGVLFVTIAILHWSVSKSPWGAPTAFFKPNLQVGYLFHRMDPELALGQGSVCGFDTLYLCKSLNKGFFLIELQSLPFEKWEFEVWVQEEPLESSWALCKPLSKWLTTSSGTFYSVVWNLCEVWEAVSFSVERRWQGQAQGRVHFFPWWLISSECSHSSPVGWGGHCGYPTLLRAGRGIWESTRPSEDRLCCGSASSPARWNVMA